MDVGCTLDYRFRLRL